MLEDGMSRFTSVTRSRSVAEGYAKPTGHGLVLTIRLHSERVVDPIEIVESKLRDLGRDDDKGEIAIAQNLLKIINGDQEILAAGGIRKAEIVDETRLGATPQEVCDGRH